MRDCDVAAEHVPNKLKVENTQSSRRKSDETPLHLLQLMGNMVLFLRNTTRVRNIPTFVGHDHTIKLNVTMFPKNAISNTLNEVFPGQRTSGVCHVMSIVIAEVRVV